MVGHSAVWFPGVPSVAQCIEEPSSTPSRLDPGIVKCQSGKRLPNREVDESPNQLQWKPVTNRKSEKSLQDLERHRLGLLNTPSSPC